MVARGGVPRDQPDGLRCGVPLPLINAWEAEGRLVHSIVTSASIVIARCSTPGTPGGREQIELSAHKNLRAVQLHVAKTSLTVRGIRYVIDAGLARMKRYSLRNKCLVRPAWAPAALLMRKARFQK